MKKFAAIISVISILLVLGCEEAAQALTTTISGDVYDDGAKVDGAMIFVLDSGDTLTAGLALSNGSITNSEGHYTVIDVVPGDHYICAVKDVNGNMSVDPGVDLIGYYGEVDTTFGISIPSIVTVHNEGDDVKNIDVLEMYSLPGE